MPWFLQLPPRRSPLLISWLQWPLDLDSGVPQTVVQETILGRLPVPGHWLDSRLRHTFQLVKEVSLLVQEHQPEGQASGMAQISGLWAALKKCRIWTLILVFPLCLVPTHQNLTESNLYNFSGAPVFVTVTQLILSDHLASRGLCLCSHKTEEHCIAKCCCLRVWLQNSLNLKYWDSSFRDIDKSWSIFNY